MKYAWVPLRCGQPDTGGHALTPSRSHQAGNQVGKFRNTLQIMRISEIKCIRWGSAEDGGEEFTATAVPGPTFFMSDNATVACKLFPAQEPHERRTVCLPLPKPSQDKLSISDKLFYLHKTLNLFQIDQSRIRRYDISLPAAFLEPLNLAFSFSLLFVQTGKIMGRNIIRCSHFLSHFTPSYNQTRSLWKSVFCWELSPCSTRSSCAVLVWLRIFDSSVLFFCLNWKFL